MAATSVANQFPAPLGNARVVEEFRHVVQRLGHILDAKVGNPQERDAVTLLHGLGQVDHRAGALHDVEAGAVGAADGFDAAVAGDGGDNLDADALVVIADHPGFAGQIEIAEDVDARLADAVGGTGADECGQAVAGRAVAVLLRAAKAFASGSTARGCLVRTRPGGRPRPRRRR